MKRLEPGDFFYLAGRFAGTIHAKHLYVIVSIGPTQAPDEWRYCYEHVNLGDRIYGNFFDNELRRASPLELLAEAMRDKTEQPTRG